jgi:hypothetical protein
MDCWLGDVSLSVLYRRLYELIDDGLMYAFVVLEFGWVRVERRGNGGGDCLFRRRRWLGSVASCYLMLFCRMMELMSGNGG